jgi:hypothetical protein
MLFFKDSESDISVNGYLIRWIGLDLGSEQDDMHRLQIFDLHITCLLYGINLIENLDIRRFCQIF